MDSFNLEPVEHPGMQATHETEVELFHQLDALLGRHAAGQAVDDEIDALLTRLLTHTLTHFANEERLMAAHRFPPAAAHAAEHRQAAQAMHQAADAWRAGRDAQVLADKLLGDHLAWMRRHVATMDYLTARFLVMAQQVEQ